MEMLVLDAVDAFWEISFHPDERPTPAEVVELTSGLQVVDHALHHAVDQRAVALPTPSDDHPLVGLELGERAAPPADRTMGPAEEIAAFANPPQVSQPTVWHSWQTMLVSWYVEGGHPEVQLVAAVAMVWQ